MTKQVLDVGNCGPDFSSIHGFLTSRFECKVVQCHGLDDTLDALRKGEYALVLINRKLDRDYTDGIEIVKQMKSDPELKDVPVMLITNFTEHQDTAVEAGAERGFGKLDFDKPETVERVRPFLEPVGA